MTPNFCDLLVVGSDLSGILAATLLAKRGMSVLVLEDDGGFEPNVLTGLESRLFKSILGKLMIPDGRLQIIEKNRVSYQVVFPRNRLDVSPNPSILFKEIQREFPELVGFFENLYNEAEGFRKTALELLAPSLPIADKKEKKRFVKLARALPYQRLSSLVEKTPVEVASFIRSQLLFLSQGVLMDPLFFQLCFLLSPEIFATYSVKGGLTELKKIFYEKIEYFGGAVQRATDGFDLVIQKKEVKGVKLPQCGFVTRCRYLLGNTNIQKIYQMIPNRKIYQMTPKGWLTQGFRTMQFKKKASRLAPVTHRMNLLYVVDSQVLPTPMKENLLLIQDPSLPLSGSNYLQLNRQPIPKNMKQEGDTLLSVSYFLPPEKLSMTVPEFEKLHEEITGLLHRLIPFAGSSLKRVSPKILPEEDGLFPESSEEYNAFRKGAGACVAYTPSFFFPTLTSPYDNMLTVGPNLLPWLGTEGKVLSALKAVDLIWGRELKLREG